MTQAAQAPGNVGESRGRRVPRVVVSGATGKTGNAVAHGLADNADVELVACVAPSAAGTPTRELPTDVERAASLDELSAEFDVLADLTNAEAAVANVEAALERGVHVVLGTTGLDDAWLEAMGARFAERGLGLLYAPNFSLGAVLMMRFSAEAARYLPGIEILEIHHEAKLDAPSGTAKRTAQLAARARRDAGVAAPDDTDDTDATAAQFPSTQPALGELVDGVPVHSMRLPGTVAHQQVVLTDAGQMLTIRHDALDRSSYASGVALAARRVMDTTGLTIGLEQLL